MDFASLNMNPTKRLVLPNADWKPAVLRSGAVILLSIGQTPKKSLTTIRWDRYEKVFVLFFLLSTTTIYVAKGQLVSKAIYDLLTSLKELTDKFVLFAFLLFTAIKSNSSVCFFGRIYHSPIYFSILSHLYRAQQGVSY